jgi:hypothetical protein
VSWNYTACHARLGSLTVYSCRHGATVLKAGHVLSSIAHVESKRLVIAAVAEPRYSGECTRIEQAILMLSLWDRTFGLQAVTKAESKEMALAWNLVS